MHACLFVAAALCIELSSCHLHHEQLTQLLLGDTTPQLVGFAAGSVVPAHQDSDGVKFWLDVPQPRIHHAYAVWNGVRLLPFRPVVALPGPHVVHVDSVYNHTFVKRRTWVWSVAPHGTEGVVAAMIAPVQRSPGRATVGDRAANTCWAGYRVETPAACAAFRCVFSTHMLSVPPTQEPVFVQLEVQVTTAASLLAQFVVVAELHHGVGVTMVQVGGATGEGLRLVVQVRGCDDPPPSIVELGAPASWPAEPVMDDFALWPPVGAGALLGVVGGTLHVSRGQTLSIRAGRTLMFRAGAGIQCDGDGARVVIAGEAGARTTLTSAAADVAWGGIRISGGCSLHMKHVLVDNTGAPAVWVDQASVTLGELCAV